MKSDNYSLNPLNRVCILPMDRRPVCYDAPRRLALAGGITPCMPAPSLLGNLKVPANRAALQRWVKLHMSEQNPVIVSLDTVAYGGLIPSRVGQEPLEEIQGVIKDFFTTLRSPDISAFSSIMRIPSYNNDQEEPDYWAHFGEKLHLFSQYRAQDFPLSDPAIQRLAIPEAVMHDFLSRRERNFLINHTYTELFAKGKIQTLVYCQDDTSSEGLNVQEANSLKQLLSELPEPTPGTTAQVLTGSDEIAMCLLARLQTRYRKHNRPLTIAPIYTSPFGKSLVAKFDGLPIETVVADRIHLCGALVEKNPRKADIRLLVHTPEDPGPQGDHCEDIRAFTSAEQYELAMDTLSQAFKKNHPVAVADVAYANGSDPQLASQIIFKFRDLTPLYGYGGWNTPGNTIGSVVAMAITRFLAEEQERFQPEAFHRLQLIRMADDWVYQTQVRREFRAQGPSFPLNESLLNVSMAEGLSLIRKRFALQADAITCHFPCQRLFEVEVAVS